MSTWVACGDCGTTGQDRYGVGVCQHCGGKGIVEMVEVEGREMSVPVEKLLLPGITDVIDWVTTNEYVSREDVLAVRLELASVLSLIAAAEYVCSPKRVMGDCIAANDVHDLQEALAAIRKVGI